MLLFPAPSDLRPKLGRRLSASSQINLLSYALIFGTLKKLRPPVPGRITLSRKSRVLLFSTGGIGDALIDSVAVHQLAAAYPGIHITMVAHHRRLDVARHQPPLDRIVPFRKGPAAFLRLLNQLRGPWDAIFFLTFHDPEAKCLGFLLNKNATFSLAWRSQFFGLAANEIVSAPLRRAHLAEQAAAVVAQAGVPSAERRMIYEVRGEERERLRGSLDALGCRTFPRIILQLGGGGQPFRDWPVSHHAALARRIVAAGLGPLAILGGPDHRQKAEEFRSLCGDLIYSDLVGQLPLPQSAALIRQASCLVSTDTGIMHLGFALRTPTVALLHPSPGPARVGPLCDKHLHRVLSLEKPSGYRLPSDVTMASITPDSVFDAVGSVLQQ